MSNTAHTLGFSVVPWMIYSNLTPFFWSVNSILTKVSAEQYWKVVVVDRFDWLPMKNCISRILKGVDTLSVMPLQYLTSFRKEKDAIQVRS